MAQKGSIKFGLFCFVRKINRTKSNRYSTSKKLCLHSVVLLSFLCCIKIKTMATQIKLSDFAQKIADDANTIGNGIIDATALKQACESLPVFRHYNMVSDRNEAVIRLKAHNIEDDVHSDVIDTGHIIAQEGAYTIELSRHYTDTDDSVEYLLIEVKTL